MKSDLSNVKVGDKIWTIQEGWVQVESISKKDVIYPILIKNYWYTLDGKLSEIDEHPSAFLSNPFEKEITREVEEEILREFIDNTTLSLESHKAVCMGLIDYLDEKYKPLPTPEHVAELAGITVEQLKEIVNYKQCNKIKN